LFESLVFLHIFFEGFEWGAISSPRGRSPVINLKVTKIPSIFYLHHLSVIEPEWRAPLRPCCCLLARHRKELRFLTKVSLMRLFFMAWSLLVVIDRDYGILH